MSDTALLLEAVAFAAHKHTDQRRKDANASPYINHPVEVARLLARVGTVTDINVLRAAVLHDTVEDTATTPDELEEHFGAAVRGLVEEVTDDKTLPKQERKDLQVSHASALSRGAKLIKFGDKIANVVDVTEHPPHDWSLRRREEYLDWTEAVVVGCRGANVALEHHYHEVLGRASKQLAALRAASRPLAH